MCSRNLTLPPTTFQPHVLNHTTPSSHRSGSQVKYTQCVGALVLRALSTNSIYKTTSAQRSNLETSLAAASFDALLQVIALLRCLLTHPPAVHTTVYIMLRHRACCGLHHRVSLRQVFDVSLTSADTAAGLLLQKTFESLMLQNTILHIQSDLRSLSPCTRYYYDPHTSLPSCSFQRYLSIVSCKFKSAVATCAPRAYLIDVA